MRARWLARRLRPAMMRLASSRRPDFEVVRDGGDVYLRRWWVWPRNRWCNLYLHQMIKSDDPILHDHMYVSLSLMLEGRLIELFVPHPEDVYPGQMPYAKRARWVDAGDLVWRSQHLAHQLVVPSKADGSPGGAWTLFLTGPRVRDWGFWCPKGWRHWHAYVALSQDPSGKNAGQSGRGVGCVEDA